MVDNEMRLRLVVRRDGFPEERLVWNVPLESNPTISKLLENVNEILPLEIGQRGLENYAVELQDADGTSFECLHFQPVRSILKPDDRVFIRALEKDDYLRRRVSGRHQISSGGRHLIDGIPFGRRLLKAPTDRPTVHPPPRKRIRLDYNQEDADGDFIGEDDSPTLLLTNGESPEGASGSSDIRIGAAFDDADAIDGDFDSDEELNDTHMDENPEPESDGQDSSQSSSSDSSYDPDADDGESADEDLEGQDLTTENAAVDNAELQTEDPTTQAPNKKSNKVRALEAAFPSVPEGICERILSSSGDDLKKAYGSLAEGFKPRQSETATLSLLSTGGLAKSKSNITQDSSSSKSKTGHAEKTAHDEMEDDEMSDDEDSSDGEEEDEASTLARKFDYRGFPSGTISSGKGLAHMAAMSGSFSSKLRRESETASATLSGSKTSPEKTLEEDDTTSNCSSSTSEDESSEAESDNDLDEDTSSEGTSSSDDDSSDDDSSDDDSSDSDDDDTSGSRMQTQNDLDNQSNDSSDDSSDDSDDGPEESSSKPTTKGNPQRYGNWGSGHNDGNVNASADSSTSEESSDSESDDEENPARAVKPPEVQKATSNIKQTEPPLVPFRAGKEATKKRNARRRAAKKAKMLEKLAQDTNDSNLQQARPSAPISDEKALFEAKRQELLDAIANGGVEVGPSSPPNKARNSSGTPSAIKRKHDEQNDLYQDDNQGSTLVETSANEDIQSSPSSQKKRRTDIGAGRRLILGALGLPNMKTMKDQIKLQAKLMKDVRPLQNQRLAQKENENLPACLDGKGPEEEGYDTWKNKIAYRAVECCHEGVQLSEPPFPFVQRWDPQQQGSWFHKKNKRGGQSKRAQRNQAHFYEDCRAGTKRSYEESSMWDEEGYDDTYNGIEENTNDADIELNYDDEEVSQPRGPNEVSQFTDLDDLPSLPSDLSDLPDLRPGEVKAGMVITWQQWSCSSATNWQPQLSNVTGVVVRIDDDATGLEVCLAKRDRNLDRNERKYDQSTGLRVYDRFEAPDLDDEEEEQDEGYRTLGFAEMQQPKILQQPLPMTTGEEPSIDTEDLRETDAGLNTSQEAQKQHTSQPEPSSIITQSMEIDTDLARSSIPRDITGDMTNFDSSIVEPVQEEHTTDRSMSVSSHNSSPSRQLHEDTSQAVSAVSQERSAQEISSREYFASDDTPDKINNNISDSSFLGVRQSSVPSFRDHQDDVVTGTPKIVKTKVTDPPSSASSARSGRQPDYAMDLVDRVPDSFKMTDDGIDGTPVIFGTENQADMGSDRGSLTPTPKRTQKTVLNTSQMETDADNARASSPANPSTPSSLASLGTVWHTAVTSLNTQSQNTQSQSARSPSMSLPVVAQPSQGGREDKKAVRDSVGFSDDQDSVSRIPDSFRHSSQVGVKETTEGEDRTAAKSPRIKLSPGPAGIWSKKRESKQSSRFSIPPGSQVIELSSDSEHAFSEDYADDAMDSTYAPDPDSLPTGSSALLVKKRNSKEKEGSASRNSAKPGKPLPFKKKQQHLSSSQSRLSSSSAPASDFPHQIKPRRKTSSKF